MYPGTEKYALKNINLTFESGSKILIVGLNGAGKSTLIKLMLRFYQPTKGRILLDDMDINLLDQQQYISLFSAIFQDYRIYAETVKENIMFEQEDMDRFEQVIHQLQIPEILKKKIRLGIRMSFPRNLTIRGRSCPRARSRKSYWQGYCLSRRKY